MHINDLTDFEKLKELRRLAPILSTARPEIRDVQLPDGVKLLFYREIALKWQLEDGGDIVIGYCVSWKIREMHRMLRMHYHFGVHPDYPDAPFVRIRSFGIQEITKEEAWGEVQSAKMLWEYPSTLCHSY